MKKRDVLISWLIMALVALVVHRILLQSEREKLRHASNAYETAVPPVQHSNGTGSAEENALSHGMELIKKADPQVYSSSGGEAPIYHSKARLSDPEYKEKYLRHKALYLYLHATVRDTQPFKDLTHLLKMHGYGEEHVYSFYDVVYHYRESERRNEPQTFRSFWAGQEETPEKRDVYNNMIQRRQDLRKQSWQRMLIKATGITDQDLINAAFEIPITEYFGVRGHPEPAEGEELLQAIKE